MSNVYFWSDMHLGDANVAGHRGYTDVTEHDHDILEAWSTTIKKRDTVYFLGDLSIHNVTGALAEVAKLPGIKRIIWGNHDPAHPMHLRSHRHRQRFLDVFETGDSMGLVKIAGVRTLLSHFSYEGDHSARDRHIPFRPQRGEANMPLIHGHVHDQWIFNGNQMNVGVEAFSAPVPLDLIAELHISPQQGESS